MYSNETALIIMSRFIGFPTWHGSNDLSKLLSDLISGYPRMSFSGGDENGG